MKTFHVSFHFQVHPFIERWDLWQKRMKNLLIYQTHHHNRLNKACLTDDKQGGTRRKESKIWSKKHKTKNQIKLVAVFYGSFQDLFFSARCLETTLRQIINPHMKVRKTLEIQGEWSDRQTCRGSRMNSFDNLRAQ